MESIFLILPTFNGRTNKANFKISKLYLLHETTSGHSYQMKGVDYNIGINFKCSLKFFWFKVASNDCGNIMPHPKSNTKT